MNINLVAIGSKMPTWVTTAYQDYAKRLPNDYALKLHEVPSQKRLKHSDTQTLLAIEANALKATVPKHNYVIALDRCGQRMTTHDLAKRLQQWHDNAHDISLLIGGPEGIAPDLLQNANEIWSLSPLTLAHPIVRVVVAEQIYRAFSILTHHPYHRD